MTYIKEETMSIFDLIASTIVMIGFAVVMCLIMTVGETAALVATVIFGLLFTTDILAKLMMWLVFKYAITD